MIEKEVKVLDIPDDMERRILEAGGKRIFDGEIRSVHFHTPGKVLRVRFMDGKAVLGYKEILNKGQVKENLEIEIEVSDGVKMIEVLERLGFRREREIRKKRKSFLLRSVRIDIDDYPGIPRLMEIEGDEKEILRVARLLGIHEHELKPWSLKDVEEYYGRRIV